MTDGGLNEIIDWCRKKLINEKKNPYGLTGKRMEGYEQAMKVVMSYLHSMKGGEAHSTADVVEIVRCKNCQYFVSEICRHDLAMNLSRSDDFCSYGERRKEDVDA